MPSWVAHASGSRSIHSPHARARTESAGAPASTKRKTSARSTRAKKPAADPALRLTGDRLVVRAPENGERKSAGGLLIPATAMPAPKRLAWGDVALVGPDVRVAKTGRPRAVPALGRARGRARGRGPRAAARTRRAGRERGAGGRLARRPRARPVPLGRRRSSAAPSRTRFSRFGSTITTDCHVPSATDAADHRERRATATRTPARGDRRRARRARADARTDRRAGKVRSRSSARSPSEPLPVSISATPAVACGTNTWRRPSPPPSRAKASTRAVMSVTQPAARLEPERLGPHPAQPAEVANVGSASTSVCSPSTNASNPSSHDIAGQTKLRDALGRPVRRRVERAEPVGVRGREQRRPQEAVEEPRRVDGPVVEQTEDRLLALDRPRRAGLLRPLDDALVVGRRRERAEDRLAIGRQVRGQHRAGRVDEREVVAERVRQAAPARRAPPRSWRTSRAGSA